MKKIITFIILINSLAVWAQTFNRVYDFSSIEEGMNITPHGDNLMINVFNNCPKACMSVMLIEAVYGDVLKSNAFMDSAANFASYASIILKDNKYYTAGDYQLSIPESYAMLFIYDKNLDSVRLAYYQDSTLRTLGFTLSEKEDKIYSWGVAGVDGQFYHGLLICSDLDGELLWMKRYRDEYRFSLRGSITNSHDGHLITTVRGRPHNEKNRGVVRKIDTDGNVLWKKEYAFNSQADFYQITLNKLGSDKYILIYHPDTTIINWEDTTWVSVPAMAYILNEDGDLLNTQVAAKPNQLRWFQNVEPTQDGGAIASGYIQIGIDQVGLLTRFDSIGNLVWDKWYKHLDHLKPGNEIPDRFEGRFNKAIEMPDGRIAVTGVILGSLEQGLSNTWVMVLDSMGCLEPGCADGEQLLGGISSSDPISTPTGIMRLAPNPANAEVTVWSGYEMPDPQGRLRVYDMRGQLVLEQVGIQPMQTLSTGHLVPGLYIVALEGSYGSERQKLVIR
jgi:hypothetical protein